MQREPERPVKSYIYRYSMGATPAETHNPTQSRGIPLGHINVLTGQNGNDKDKKKRKRKTRTAAPGVTSILCDTLPKKSRIRYPSCHIILPSFFFFSCMSRREWVFPAQYAERHRDFACPSRMDPRLCRCGKTQHVPRLPTGWPGFPSVCGSAAYEGTSNQSKKTPIVGSREGITRVPKAN